MTDKKLECFVISPIGSPGSPQRREADWVLRKLIRPALEDTYNVIRADEFTKGEIITNRVITSIQNADLLVAVMSGHNPNVFYELAVAHAYSKPVVPLIKDGESIPFDVGLVGTIFYSHEDVAVWDAAIDQLMVAADATRVSGYQVSNPITMALGAAKASASPDSTEQMVAKLTAELAATRREVAEMQSIVAPQRFENALAGLASGWQSRLKYHSWKEAAANTLQAVPLDGVEHAEAVLIGKMIEREVARLGRALTPEEIAAEVHKFYNYRATDNT